MAQFTLVNGDGSRQNLPSMSHLDRGSRHKHAAISDKYSWRIQEPSRVKERLSDEVEVTVKRPLVPIR